MQTSRFDFDKISNYDVEFSMSWSALEKKKDQMPEILRQDGVEDESKKV